MDINHIKLPGAAIAGLYTSSLIDTGETVQSPKIKTETIGEPAKTTKETSAKTWKWLGENGRNILVVVNYADAVHLPDQQLQFLTNMLTACKLSLADVAIINLQNQPQQEYKEIIAQFKSKVVLLFDIEPASFGLPMSFPVFQIQPFANSSFLYSPSLEEVESDKLQKSKLWVSLKRLFNI